MQDLREATAGARAPRHELLSARLQALAAENKAVLDALEAVIALAEKFDAEPAIAAFLRSKAPQHANILLRKAGRK